MIYLPIIRLAALSNPPATASSSFFLSLYLSSFLLIFFLGLPCSPLPPPYLTCSIKAEQPLNHAKNPSAAGNPLGFQWHQAGASRLSWLSPVSSPSPLSSPPLLPSFSLFSSSFSTFISSFLLLFSLGVAPALSPYPPALLCSLLLSSSPPLFFPSCPLPAKPTLPSRFPLFSPAA